MIVLANGDSYNAVAAHIIKENIDNQIRDVFDIYFDTEEYDYDTISKIYESGEDAFKSIKIYETVLIDEEEKSTLVEERVDFVLMQSLDTIEIDGSEKYAIRVAQLTPLDKQQIEQAETITMLEECLLEMSEIIYA